MTQIKDAEHLPAIAADAAGDHLATITREILRAIKSVDYGSVEIIIRNSRVVQIERKEKFRFD